MSAVIMEGHRDRDGGSVSVLGFDPATGGRAYRERIGIVLQEAGFEEEFSVAELVRLYAGFYPRHRDPDEVIDQVGLSGKRTARVRTLSGGQRRRLDLALGLVGRPELLFLDEPTTGFDPSARHHAWELIDGLRALGTTILLTTHYMDEAQHLADRVAVLRDGRLAAIGTPDTLGGAQRGSVLSFRLPDGAVLADLPALTGEIEAHGAAVAVRTSDTLCYMIARAELGRLLLSGRVRTSAAARAGRRPRPCPSDRRCAGLCVRLRAWPSWRRSPPP